MKQYMQYDSPIGPLYIGANDTHICELSFTKREGVVLQESALLKEAVQQLEEYFSGKRKVFSLPLAPKGTPFQEKTWQALLEIPYGQTWSYKQLAVAAGNVNASRAVGGANNKNPIVIMIPCHRVIGSSGKLVGYGGGLDKKEFLLALEQRYG